MANQIPLIVNAGAGQIQQLATGDNLSVTANVVTGNILAGGYFYANGQPFSGGANIDLTQVATDIIPVGNNTQSLGNATNQWQDIYVSNATIYFDSVPLTVDGSGQLTFDGNAIVQTGTNVINTGNVETTGDVIAGNLVIATGGNLQFADGSVQTSAYGNANIEAYLPTYTGDLSAANITSTGLTTIGELYSPSFYSNAIIFANTAGYITSTNLFKYNPGTEVLTVGSISTTGNIAGNSFVLNNAGNLTYSSIQQNQNPPYGGQAFGIEMLTTTDDPGVFSSVSAGPDYVSLKSTNAGNANITLQGGYGVTISTSNATGGSIKNWTFTAAGAALFPGNISSSGNVFAGNLSATGNTYGTNVYSTGLITATGNIRGANFNTDGEVSAVGNVYGNNIIASDLVSTTGNIIGTIVRGNNVYSENLITATGNIRGANFNTDGGLFALGEISTSGNVTAINLKSEGNVSVQGNVTAGGFFSSVGNVTASYIIGNGSLLTNLNGANVVGEVAVANTVSNPSQPNITALGTIVSLTANALTLNGQFTANGNAQFNADVYFAGNVTIPGNINQISGNSGQYFGNAITGFGALYAGIPSGYTLLNNEVVQFSDNYDGYAQVSHRNINGGAQATTDYVATADNGDDATNYVDLGVAGSGYNGALANNSLGTSLYANDGYLYARGNVTGGNLVIGSAQANGVVRIIAGGSSNINDVVATFSTNGLSLTGGISTVGVSSPAPVISGFTFSGPLANISGNVIGGNVLTAGYVSAAGNVTGANFNTVGNVSVQGAVIANGNITGGNFSTTGNILGAGNFSVTGNAVASNFDTAGNILGAGNFSVTGNAIAGTFSTLGNITGANISTPGKILAEGNVYTESWLVANNFGIETYQINVTTNANVTGNVNAGNLNIGTAGGLVDVDGNTISLTTNAGNSGTFINLNGNTGVMILGADSNVVFGIGASTYIDISDNGILMDANITSSGGFNFTGWNNISGNTLSASGNITGDYATFSDITLNDLSANAILYTDANRNVFNTDFSYNATTQTMSGGNISTTGNVAAGYFYGDGSNLTGVGGNYSDSNVVTLLSSFGSNTISTTGNVSTGNIVTGGGTGGNITGVNIMSANVFIGDGGNLTNLPSSGLVVNSMTSGANITASVNDTQYNVTALAVSANVTAPTGVAQDGQKLTYRIIDNGSAQALTWDAAYQEIGTTLPTTTVASKYVYVGVIYNAQETTWDVVSVAQQA